MSGSEIKTVTELSFRNQIALDHTWWKLRKEAYRETEKPISTVGNPTERSRSVRTADSELKTKEKCRSTKTPNSNCILRAMIV